MRFGCMFMLTILVTPSLTYDCILHDPPKDVQQVMKIESSVLHFNETEKCQSSTEYCFVLWWANTNTVIKAGCWNVGGKADSCESASCTSRSKIKSKDLADNRFCCCIGDLCNLNVTDEYNASLPELDISDWDNMEKTSVPAKSNRIVFLGVSVAVIVALFIILIGFVWLVFAFRKRNAMEDVTSNSNLLLGATSGTNITLDQPSYNIEERHIHLLDRIGGGASSEVWHGRFQRDDEMEADVAVKVFTGHNAWLLARTEHDVYTLPAMCQKQFLKYFGLVSGLSIDRDGIMILFPAIVLEAVPIGTLTGYLKNHPLDWSTFCKMSQSVVSGLNYLHEEIYNSSGELDKPAIAHRDLNTRNILVRDDLQCVLCDFGFSMVFTREKRHARSEGEQASLNDVGTYRYMAPELLEGAINLGQCEAALKQVDIYALALVLWELGSRCKDLYQGLPVPQYHLPYQKELGLYPSYEELQNAVSRDKKRPLFPDVWKDSNPAVKYLKETIEDCWDQDAEARLTASCVEERLAEIELLWDGRKKTELPVNTNFHIDRPIPATKKPKLCNDTSPAPESTMSTGRDLSTSTGTGRDLSTSTIETPISPMTVPTVVLAPPDIVNPYSYDMYFSRRNQRTSFEVQAPNPVSARNTHKRSDEDLEVEGNVMYKKGQHRPRESEGSSSQPPSSLSASRSSAADRRTVRRIPMLQNDVASEPVLMRPKHVNVESNNDQWQNAGLLHRLKLKLPFKKRGAGDAENGGRVEQYTASTSAGRTAAATRPCVLDLPLVGEEKISNINSCSAEMSDSSESSDSPVDV